MARCYGGLQLWVLKMGVTDITIIAGILIFFFSVSLVLPFINDSFIDYGVSDGDDDIGRFITNLTDYTNSTQNINDDNWSLFDPASWIPKEILMFFRIIFTFMNITFWGFGSVPFWLNMLLFWPLRLILILVIARNIWVGGGG